MYHKLRSPFIGSFLIHALILLGVVVAMNGDSRVEEVPITLEHISLSDRVKKVIHKAVHTIGIPHEEPQDSESPQSATDSRKSTSNASEEAEGGGIAPTEMQKYLLEIVSRINRVKKYPKEAQFSEQEGMVSVMIEISPDGKILQTKLEKTGPFESLNGAALQAVQKIGDLPPLPLPPSGKPVNKPIQLHVPIHFQLK